MRIPRPGSRAPGGAVLVMAGLCVLAAFGLAFTVYGEIALGLSVVLGAGGGLLMARSDSAHEHLRFQPPPGWPAPPAGWRPGRDWHPDPSWPPAPPGWRYWVPISKGERETQVSVT